MADAGIAKDRLPPCAICRRPAVAPYMPFCSRRCADVDLGRWFGEGYRIPGSAPDPSDAGDDDSMG